MHYDGLHYDELLYGKRKRSKKEQVRVNAETGRAFQERQMTYHRIMGHTVERIPDSHGGADAKITEHDLWTGKNRSHFEEYKSSATASLTPKEESMKRRYGKRYRVIRPGPFG